jgi:L,D-peptidoglycan transpeptidase YkuD (ErfK/YbiS/YcfS/YnhG family)
MFCALGKGGMVAVKREGDGGTPIGAMRCISAWLRTDRVKVRAMALPVRTITTEDGWCDAVGDRNYNRPVRRPYPASHEEMKRDDRLYDTVVVLDHNITRRMGRGGSAIFFHIAREGFEPTEGCVALMPKDMAWLRPQIGPQTVMVVG